MSITIESQIKKPVSQIFRRAKIRRRRVDNGKFEDGWVDISKHVKSYGKLTSQVDSARRFKFNFATGKLVVDNRDGHFNPSDSPPSYWFGYMDQQRTLVNIEAGFRTVTTDTNGLNTIGETPSATLWDSAIWDEGEEYVFDDTDSSSIFIGILSGDIPLNDKIEVTLNLRPLVSVFQDYPAKKLTGWTSTGLTASQFVTMVRDQVDGNGEYIFRPFFGDTTSNWEISTTSTVFSNLNTSTAADVIDKSVWEVIEKLSEVENFVPYITRNGIFKFISRTSAASSTSFEFHGAGSFNTTYGQTIKAITSYGFRISKYYSRVQLKWNEASTSTSYSIQEADFEVNSQSPGWIYGLKTLSLENLYIPNASVADALALAVFNDVSGFKKEIDISTTFIPHLELFDRVAVYYDPTEVLPDSLWDINNWADTGAGTDEDLVFDPSGGNAIYLTGEEFKLLSMEIDLDNLENRFVAREV